jgi:hypothetical protein
VDTHRTIDVGVAISQGFDVGGVFGADTDTQEVPYPTLAGSLKSGVEGTVVLGEVEAIKVAMGIYEHRKSGL